MRRQVDDYVARTSEQARAAAAGMPAELVPADAKLQRVHWRENRKSVVS
jgi:hypothetical protein